MITVFLSKYKCRPEVITSKNQGLLREAIWIDLLHPTDEEEQLVERLLHLNIPVREEMQGIEPSTRLYKEDDSVFMTTTMIAKSDSLKPTCEAVTLIVKENKLITVRYIEPQAFALFISQLPKIPANYLHPAGLIITLLETSIDRLSDIAERVGISLDDYSATLFGSQATDKVKLDYKRLLQDLGYNGDLNAKAWESLVSFNRLNGFFSQAIATQFDEHLLSRMTGITKDIVALSDQVKFLSSKINFLLDATLGMVNIEQNNIIKIFSIAAVIFLPPTLIASIYGMNFIEIPGLSSHYGYHLSLCLMLLSSWLPYKYFKIKKWI